MSHQVIIRDFGPFILLVNPISKVNNLGVAIEKGGIIARLDSVADRVMIVLEKWMTTHREVIDQIPEDLIETEARGDTPQDTLCKIMTLLTRNEHTSHHA